MISVSCEIVDASGQGVHGVVAVLACTDDANHTIEQLESTSDWDGTIRDWYKSVHDTWWATGPVQIPASTVTVTFLPTGQSNFARIQSSVKVTDGERVQFMLSLHGSTYLMGYMHHPAHAQSQFLELEMSDVSEAAADLCSGSFCSELVGPKPVGSDLVSADLADLVGHGPKLPSKCSNKRKRGSTASISDKRMKLW